MSSTASYLNQLKQYHTDFENFKDLTPVRLESSLKLATSLHNLIQSEALFSSNELLEDLPSESIPFLLVPYYQACIHLKIQDLDRRKTNLEFAEGLIDEFLTLLDDYRLTPENFKEHRKNLKPPTREEKILAFKTKKSLEETIKAMEGQQPDDCRELYVKQLELAAIQSLEHLDFIKLELQMLAMKDLPKPEPQAYRPPQVVRIDESNVHMMPRVISGSGDIAMIRENMRNQVFTQRNAPTMTIEEYGEWAKKEMDMREAATKKAQKEAPEYNSDDEQQYEAKRKEDSEWDNWKDENEKGVGNRNGR